MCLARAVVRIAFNDDDDDDDDDDDADESSSSSMHDDDDAAVIRIAHDAPRVPLGPVINSDNDGALPWTSSTSGKYLCSNSNCPQKMILLQGFAFAVCHLAYDSDKSYMSCRRCGHSMWIPTGRHEVVHHGPVYDSASAQYLCSNLQCPQRVNLLQGFVVSYSYEDDRPFMSCRACGFSMWIPRGRHDSPES